MSDMRVSEGVGGTSCERDVNEEVDTEISLTDILVAIGQQKYFILRWVLVAIVLGVVVSFLLPSVYVGQTVIMPPEQNRSGVSALAGIGELAGLGGSLGVKTPDDIYVGLLQSDAIANDLIARFKLKERYRAKLTSDARSTLRGKVQVTSDKKSGFITVKASDKSPVFAAELANAYIDELRKLLDRLAITDAQQRRVFFQQQIDKTLSRLSEAQSAFNQAQKKSGVVSLDEQVSSTIRASADLKARIAALEVQLQSMRTYATDNNPEIQRVTAEIQAMRGQLDTIEQGDVDASAADERSADSVALANIRAYREIKYQEALLDQFRKQLELARVDEAKEGPLIQQVDVALPPDRRSSPRRSLIVMICGLAGALVGVCAALIRAGGRSDSQFARQFERIKLAWRLRGPGY